MFIDDILMSDEILREWPGTPTRESAASALRNVFVVKSQNVWDYLRAHCIHKDILRADYPNVAPTMPGMWFEWVAETDAILDPDTGKNRSGRLKMGVLCSADDLTLMRPEAAKPILDGYREFGANPGPETRWAMLGMVFIQLLEPGNLPYILGMVSWRVGHNGELLPSAADNGLTYKLNRQYATQNQEDFAGTLCGGIHTTWLALSFMHCKNIQIIKSPPITDALRRARERRGKPPLFRHHTLVIDPSKPVTRGQATGNAGSGGTALHICRGHFKDYGERGLFGKYTGTYWWPMHARGSAAHGTVDKDYEVRT